MALKNCNNIFLVGPMGAGKSTVGRRLAKQKKLRFFDCDHEIEKRTGVSIAVIFEIEGEEGFRRREKQILEELTRHMGVVLATGGGVVLDPENRKILSERGFVIYLKANIEQLFQRTGRDKKRPLLDTDHPREKIGEILEERAGLYEEIADLIVDTDFHTVRSVVDDICSHQALK
jgi:shikimate kinase